MLDSINPYKEETVVNRGDTVCGLTLSTQEPDLPHQTKMLDQVTAVFGKADSGTLLRPLKVLGIGISMTNASIVDASAILKMTFANDACYTFKTGLLTKILRNWFTRDFCPGSGTDNLFCEKHFRPFPRRRSIFQHLSHCFIL